MPKKGVFISNDNYKSVCKAINDIPSISEAEGVKIIWDAQIDDLIAKISNLDRHKDKYSMVYIRPDLIDLVVDDVIGILEEAKNV